MADYFLKFADEAEANGVLFEVEKTTKPVLVTTTSLKKTLDSLLIDEVNLTVTYENKSYKADAGEWFEMVPWNKPIRPKYTAVDVIGTIYKPTGIINTTAEGDVPEMAPIEGWHVNVRHAGEATELDAFVVQVDNPVRMWA
jgi:hypothetical protein